MHEDELGRILGQLRAEFDGTDAADSGREDGIDSLSISRNKRV
jgi:hypothetical protein